MDPNSHFLGSWAREIKPDGEKGYLKCGIYIGATPRKNLANIKKQLKHIDWGPTDPPQ